MNEETKMNGNEVHLLYECDGPKVYSHFSLLEYCCKEQKSLHETCKKWNENLHLKDILSVPQPTILFSSFQLAPPSE